MQQPDGSDWLMAFHPGKCSVLSVTKKKQPIQHNYILHYHILESVSSAKYLGITVQSNLKWDKYINNITSKGNKALGFLNKGNNKITELRTILQRESQNS
jgi:hypothetical protein